MSELFTMPILGTRDTISWRPTREDQERAKANHGGQSLEKLKSRNGLDWAELRAVLADEDYRPMSEKDAARSVGIILQQRLL